MSRSDDRRTTRQSDEVEAIVNDAEHGAVCHTDTAHAIFMGTDPLQQSGMVSQNRLQKDAHGSGSHEVRVALEGFDFGLSVGIEATDPDSSEKKRRSLEVQLGMEMPLDGSTQDVAYDADALIGIGERGIEKNCSSSPEPTSLAKKKREELRGEDPLEGRDGVKVEVQGTMCTEPLNGQGNIDRNIDRNSDRTSDRTSDRNWEDQKEEEGGAMGSKPESPAQPPSQFVCPITMEVMLDPVILASGHTYDRESITAWLKTRKTDPMTGMRLRHTEMVPNHALKSAIVEWLEQSGGGVRMQRGASCLPEGALSGGEVRDGVGDRVAGGHLGGFDDTDGDVGHVGLPAGSSVAEFPDAAMMEQAHDEIIWAMKKHGTRLFTASADGTCRVWDVDSRRCVHVFDDHRRPVLCISIFSEKYLCTGGYDHRINVYDIDTYRHVATLEGHADAVRCLVVVDGTLVSGSYDGTCRCWDFEGVRDVDVGAPDVGRASPAACLPCVRAECKSVLQGHKGPVRALASVGGRVFSASYDSTVKCWDIKTGTCLGTLKGHTKPVRALASLCCGNPGGPRGSRHEERHYVASGSDDTTVRIWDTQSLRCVATLRGHTDNVRSLASVPGKYIISGSWDKTIRVWDCKRWNEVACLRGHSEATLALAVSMRAGVIVSGSFDCTVRAWSLDTFQCQRVFDIHSDAVRVLELDEPGPEGQDEPGGQPGQDRPGLHREGKIFCYSGGYDGSVGALQIL